MSVTGAVYACQDFRRVNVDLGRCDICDAARVAYKCEEKQMKICEGCYGGLVREWNMGGG